jgi:hypothetical protein
MRSANCLKDDFEVSEGNLVATPNFVIASDSLKLGDTGGSNKRFTPFGPRPHTP